MLSIHEKRLADEATAASKLHAMTDEQAVALADTLGIGDFVALCRRCGGGHEPSQQLLGHWVRVARAYTAVKITLKLPYASMDRLDAARREDAQRFGETLQSALDGNTHALVAVKRWLAPAGTSQPSQQAPIHRTAVSPPAAPAPSTKPASASNTGPSRGLSQSMQQVERPASDSNVREFPGADTRDNEGSAVRSDDPQRTVLTYDQVEVYGRDRVGGTALQFENSPTRDRKATTINMSIGRAKKVRTQDGVDWQRKIMVMLTGDELLLVYAVLLELLDSFRSAGHGAANDKWFEISEVTDPGWAGQIRVTLAQGKGPTADIRSCGIPPKGVGGVIDVCTRAVISQFPSAGDMEGAVRLAKRAAGLYQKSKAAEQLRQTRAAG